MSLVNIIDDVIDIKDAIVAKDIKAGWGAEIKLQQDLFALVYANQAGDSPAPNSPEEKQKLKAACDDCVVAINQAQAAVAAGPVGKWGDGKILDFLKKVLPIILELLPLFVEPAPTPG